MLILAGVSLNATIGENGIITRAQEAKIIQGIAVLQEQVNYKKIEKTTEDLYEIRISDFSYNEYPNTGFLKRVSYGAGDTYVFDFNYINRLSDGIESNLVGGEGIQGSLSLLRNVYGINEDFTVWYIDENGKMYGTESIQEIPIDVNQIVNTSIGLKEGLGITGDVTVGDVRGKKTLTLDGNNMSTPITNIEELSLMPNLTELTLKNLNLTDLNGLQYLANLKSLWLDNTKVNDYSGLKYGINVTGFYPINNSITEENIISVTDEFINMPKLEVVRIRNNSELTNIPALNTLGNINTLYIEENANLTNIFGLSTVKDKTKLVNLYLNENNLTDIINTNEKDQFNHLIPNLSENNIINMSYINGYKELQNLNCGKIGGSWVYYENGESDTVKTTNNNLHYFNAINNDNFVGVSNLSKLKILDFEGCDILDIDTLVKGAFTQIEELNLIGSENLEDMQINSIIDFLNNIKDLFLSSKYITLINSAKPTLNLSNTGITDLSFLEGNTVTTTLYLNGNTKIDNSQTKYIAGMKQLKSLSISSCTGITEFDFLKELVNLKSLSANGTVISSEDLSSLPYGDNMEILFLERCSNITDLNWLSNFPNAYIYDYLFPNLDENYDLTPINNRKLDNLWLAHGDLTKVQDCINQLNIESDSGYCLYLDGNTNFLKKLELCTRLTQLSIRTSDYNSGTNSFSGENTLNLSNCKELKKIYFRRTSIENLILTGCENLENIKIYDMQQGEKWNISDFSQNTNLKSLDLSKNYLQQTDFNSLIDMLEPKYENDDLVSGTPNLEKLTLNDNQFSSLEPLEKLSGKTANLEVYISNNSLISLNGIENLLQLTLIDLQGNSGITNITPILNLKNKEGNNLKTVKINGCINITEEMKNQMRDAGINVEE